VSSVVCLMSWRWVGGREIGRYNEVGEEAIGMRSAGKI